MRRLARWTIRIAFLLVLAGLVWCGWYAYHFGFTRKWQRYVIDEFRKRGVEISFQRLALDPFAGLVAHDVVIKDSKDSGRVLAAINRIVLDINYGNFIHGLPFINAIDLRDARLSLPLNPSDRKGAKLEVTHLNARLLLPPHQIYLAQAEALLGGVRISATGRLINPEAFQPSAPASEEDAGKRAAFAESLLRELKKMRPDSAPPSLEVRFSGNLADPGSLFVEAALSGENIRFGTSRIDRLSAALNFQDGVCNLKRFTLADGHGTLDASGRFDSADGSGTFRIRSSLDAQTLLREFGMTKPLDEFVFYSMPTIDISGKIERADGLRVALTGSIAQRKFALRSAMFDSFGANFSWDGASWYLTDVRLANKTGNLLASVLSTPGGFQLKLQSSLNPKTLLPVFSGHDTEFLGLLEFDQPPRIQFAMKGPSANLDACEGEGEIRLGRTRLRNVALVSATSKIRIRDKTVRFENFKIDRAEGGATGTFVFDRARHEVRLDRIKTNLNPSEAILWVNPEFLQHVTPYHFKKPPNLAINGVVQFDGGKNTHLEILVDAPGGMDYVFLKKTLAFPNISGRLLFTDERLKIGDLAGTLFAGRLQGGAEFSFSKKNPGYTANLAVQHVDFDKLTNLYFNYRDSKGELNGAYKFSGTGPDPRRMEGRGGASVTNGNVFAIPILGPLSGLLNEVIPGAGFNTAHRAAVDFDIADGVIRTRDLLVQGNGFNMIGGGDLFFLDDKMNFHVRMNARGIPGVVLFPVSKLFEYVSDGSMSKPAWRPKAIPRVFPPEKKQ